jgi:hypothetical protein
MRKSLCIACVIAIFSTGMLAAAGAAPAGGQTQHASRHRAPPAPQPYGEITSFSSSSAPSTGTNHPPKK